MIMNNERSLWISNFKICELATVLGCYCFHALRLVTLRLMVVLNEQAALLGAAHYVLEGSAGS
jgi:hypothetical protein